MSKEKFLVSLLCTFEIKEDYCKSVCEIPNCSCSKETIFEYIFSGPDLNFLQNNKKR